LAALTIPFAAQSQAPVILKTDTVSIACASQDTFLYPVRVKNFTGVASFQFTLNFNPAHLDYAYITPGASNPFFTGNFTADFDTTTFVNQGRFTFAWTRVGGASFPDNTPVFFIAFRRISGPYSPVTFVNSPIVIEVTDKNADELPYALQTGGVLPFDNIAPTISCPADRTVATNGPSVVNNIAPTAVNDNCLPPVQQGWSSVGATVANFPNNPNASGSVFNLGLSVITYKVTDVGNNTATCSFNLTLTPTNTSDTLTIVAANGNASCGTPFSIPITALNFDSLGSLQFSMQWDKAILKLDSFSVIGSALQLNSTNFDIVQAPNGRMSFAWTSPTSLNGGTTIANGALLFRLHFSIISNGSPLTSLQFGDLPSVREAFKALLIPEEVPAFYIPGQINITDNTPPTLVCPANISVATNPGELTAVITGTAPTTLNDACSATTLNFATTGATTNSGTGNANGTYNAGSTTVVYTAADASGNSTTCSFTIIVDAGRPAVLALDTVEIGCAGGVLNEFDVNITVENFADLIGLQFSVKWDNTIIGLQSVVNVFPGLNLPPSAFIYADTAAGIFRFLGGAVGANPSWPDIPDGGTFFTLRFKVKTPGAISPIDFLGPYDAVNAVFNSVPLTTINGGFKSGADKSGPQFLNCPKDTVVVLPPGQCQVSLLYKIELDDDCSGVDTLTSNFPTGVYPGGISNVVFTAVDSVGNTSQCAFEVKVTLTNDLKLTKCPPAKITVFTPPNSCEEAVSWTVPEIEGVCDIGAVKLTSNFKPGDVFKANDPRLVQYIAQDTVNSLIASCQFTVEVLDKIAPQVTCPKDTIITPVGGACNVVVDFKVSPATDNCDTQVEINGTSLPKDTFSVGTTIVTIIATDDSKNFSTCTFSITILDKEAPFFTCPKDTAFYTGPNACEAMAFWKVPQAFDNCDTTVLFAQTQTPPGTVFAIGSSSVTYTASDKSGNSLSCNFVVTVLDTIKPSITCPQDIIVELPLTKCDTTVTWTPLTVKDNCGIKNVSTTHIPGSKFNAGTTKVTYTIEDNSGNKSTCSFNVTAKDFVAPKFDKCLKDTTITTADSCGTTVIFALPTATDNCSPKDSLKYSTTSQSGSVFSIGTTKVAITVVDLSGNSDKCEFNITIKSSAVPKFINVPSDITITGCSGVATWTEPKAIGICQAVISSTKKPGETFPIGMTTVTYTATDLLGNTYTATFKVIVSEPEPPKFSNCPANNVEVDISGKIIADLSNFLTPPAKPSGDCKGVILTFATPLATDNCGIVTVEQTSGNISTDTFPMGVTQVVFRATDAAGNSVTCALTVTVLGLVQPDITSDVAIGCPGDDIVLSVKNPAAGTTYKWNGPKGPYADGTMLEVIQLDDTKAGIYTVKGVIGGCETSLDSFTVIIAKKPDAVNDLSLQIDPGMMATFDLVRNDIITPAGDFTFKIACPVTGLDTAGNGIIKYTAPNVTGAKITSCYEICSKACPKLCDMATMTITIRDTDCEFLPNIITPNGDNENDIFLIPCLDTGLFDDQNSLVIYNQWGDKVFEAAPYSNDPTKAWNGTLENEAGKDLPDGTYFYIFRPSPTKGVRKGFVEILR
jgi:gliding motility-associated-like protein